MDRMTRRDPGPLLISALAAILAFALQALLWVAAVRPFYFPWGDEFSMLVNSVGLFHPSVRAWFLEGFAHCFSPYPDLFEGGSNFIRPVVNVIYFTNYLLFGSHWEGYLLSNYLFHALVVGATVYIARRYLAFSRGAAWCTAVLTFLSPAVENHVLYLPSFAFDSLDAALVLAGIILLVGGRYRAAWLVLLVATFTKEMSWFAPLAAAAVVALLERERSGRWRLLRCAAFVLILLPCLSLRTYVFHGQVGAYTLAQLTSLHGIVLSLGRGLLKWPGMPLTQAEAGLGTQWRPELGGHWYAHVFFSFGALLSLVFWALLAREFINGALSSRGDGHEHRARITLLVFLPGSLALPVAGCLAARFGALAYPLLFLFVLDLLRRPVTKRFTRAGAFGLLSFVGLCSVVQKSEMLGGQRRDQRLLWAMSRSYVELLRSSTAPVILTLDDLSGASASPEFVARFSGYRGLLIRGTDLELDASCREKPISSAECSSAQQCSFVSHADERCGENELRNVDPRRISPERTLWRSVGPVELHYRFGMLGPGPVQAQDVVVRVSSHASPIALLFLAFDEGGIAQRYVLLQSSAAR